MMRKFVLIIFSLCLINIHTSAPAVCAYETSQNADLQGNLITIPAGASFTAKMQSTVSSANLKAGDSIAAVLNEDWIYNGIPIAAAGSILYGNAIQVEQSGKGYKNGAFELRFNEIITTEGKSIPIASNTYALGVDENRPLKFVTTMAKTGMAILLDIGSRPQTYTRKHNKTYATGRAVAILADSALNTFLDNPGKNVELPRNTIVKIKLSHHIYITV